MYLTKSELKKGLKELTKRAREASEGYIYLRSDGEIRFNSNSNIEFRNGIFIIAGHHTPLKNFNGNQEKLWIDSIIAD